MKHYQLLLLLSAIVVLFALNLLVGSIHIPAADVLTILFGDSDDIRPSWRYIVLESRLPQAVTALLCGGALAVSGLMLQTAFRNGLADPSIFGISSGAGLGVALVMLLLGGSIGAGAVSVSGYVAIILAAFVGAMSVMALIFFFSTVVRSEVMLLIIGIMIGYLSSSAISLLQFFATDEGVKSYMVWGMGSFGGVSMKHLPVFAAVTLSGIVGSLLLVKPLNALLLGDRYAENRQCAALAAARHGAAHRRHHRLLRPGVVHRTGRSPYSAPHAAHRQSPAAHAGHHPLRLGGCPVVQPRVLSARRERSDTPRSRHAADGRSRHHLCDSERKIAIKINFLYGF